MLIDRKIAKYTEISFYEQTLESLKHCEEHVVWLLHHYPETRDSDSKLIYAYWHSVDKARGHLKGLIVELTSTETITRTRRKIQNGYGMYLPLNEDTQKKRKIRESVFRR